MSKTVIEEIRSNIVEDTYFKIHHKSGLTTYV